MLKVQRDQTQIFGNPPTPDILPTSIMSIPSAILQGHTAPKSKKVTKRTSANNKLGALTERSLRTWTHEDVSLDPKGVEHCELTVIRSVSSCRDDYKGCHTSRSARQSARLSSHVDYTTTK